MDCPQTRDWLLQADDPRPERCDQPEVAEHLAGCSACQSLAAELLQLQAAWRAIPLPESADAARQAFLDRLPPQTLPMVRPPRRVWKLPRWIAAAAVLLGVGLAVWMLAPTPEANAAPSVVERLVDWNLELAQASPEQRPTIFARVSALKAEAVQVSMPDADRELANLLLDNGTWLASNDDPIAAAERFSAVADKLVEHVQTASERKEHHLANRYAKLQNLVAENGVANSLQKAEARGAVNFEHQRRLEKIILRDEKRMKQLVELLESNPNLSRKEIRKALDIQKNTKHRSSGSKHKPAAVKTTGGTTPP
jgi:hypothetical protein